MYAYWGVYGFWVHLELWSSDLLYKLLYKKPLVIAVERKIVAVERIIQPRVDGNARIVDEEKKNKYKYSFCRIAVSLCRENGRRRLLLCGEVQGTKDCFLRALRCAALRYAADLISVVLFARRRQRHTGRFFRWWVLVALPESDGCYYLLSGLVRFFSGPPLDYVGLGRHLVHYVRAYIWMTREGGREGGEGRESRE